MKYAIQTFGCKVNQYESAAIAAQMDALGFAREEDVFAADILIVNSCCVTENSEKKAKRLIQRVKAASPQCITALTGCFAQSYPEKAAALPVDIIAGANKKDRLALMISDYISCGTRSIDLPAYTPDEPYVELGSADMGKTRAFIKIEDGCDRYCSYCIIPHARGRVRSRGISEIIDETRFQCGAGHKEMVIVGINLSRYGIDIGLRLPDAVRAVCSVEGVERVRLSSLEPELLTIDDIKQMSKQKKLCPHFHLALQSGCEATLRRMNRRYTPSRYLETVNAFREYFGDCAVTTDIMVGFAGETDEEFSQSLDFVKRVGFAGAHVFTYSPREKTAAAKFKDPVPQSVAAERYKTMTALVKTLKRDFYAAQVRKTQQVLIQRRESADYANGLTPLYVPVRIYGSAAQKHDIINVRITSAFGTEYCAGEEIE